MTFRRRDIVIVACFILGAFFHAVAQQPAGRGVVPAPTRPRTLSIPPKPMRASVLGVALGSNFVIAEPVPGTDGEVLSTFDVGVVKAVRSGDVQAVAKALKAGFKINSPIQSGAVKGLTLLALGVDSRSVPMVRFLLMNGADANSKLDVSTYAQVPVLAIATAADDDMIAALVQGGARINERTGGDITALHWAGLYGAPHAAVKLLELGADVNAASRSGRIVGDTPLGAASRYQFPNEIPMAQRAPLVEAVVKVLLAAGANPNLTGVVGKTPGWTPLHNFAGRGPLAAVKDLVAAGANVNTVFLGTPLDSALEEKQEEIATFLKSVGAVRKAH